jgi:hypothetical protein
VMTARVVGSCLRLSEKAGVDKGDAVSQQSVRRSALDDQADCAQTMPTERRPGGLAVAVLIALGEVDAMVRELRHPLMRGFAG